MINKEESKIENIKNIEITLQNDVVKNSIKELSNAKKTLESFCSQLATKFNSIRLQQIEEAKAKEKEKVEKEKAKIEEAKTIHNPSQEKKVFDKKSNDRPFGANKPNAKFDGNKKDRPFNKNGQNKPFVKPFNKEKSSSTYVEPIIINKEKERNIKSNKKKPNDNLPEKKTLSKKAQFKLSLINDDQEDVVRFRRVKTKKVKEQEVAPVISVIDKAVMDTEMITVKDLSEKIGKPVTEIVKQLFVLGIMSTINSSIDFDTAELVCSELGITLEYKKPETFEEKLSKLSETQIEASKLVRRAPVVTVMGHVDHGKTSLLDAIRKTNVISGEAGGITQHIGAYTVKINGEMITFIDTPGHSAFSAMRERGANLTDVAILVVAADDGIMPQTVEAIKHIKNAKVPMIVAINKIDKQGCNVERIKQQLADYDVLSDEWGGDTIMVPISAKENKNIDKLLEMVLLQSEVLDLKADPTQKATGTVIEAKLDKGKGPMASILVQNGTLHVGDTMVVGLAMGRIRALEDENGKSVKSAGPSTPVSVLGLDEVPMSGDKAYVVDEKLSKQLIEERKTNIKRSKAILNTTVSAEDLFNKADDNLRKQLNVIIKADVQGSSEALKESVEQIVSEEVKLNIISCSVGNVNETDAELAKTTGSVIICFNTKPDSKSRVLIEREKIEIYYSKIIYDVIDYLTNKMKSMFAPRFREVYVGSAEVRVVYKVSNVGIIAGSLVLDGKVIRGCEAKVVRGKEIFGPFKIESLKIRKDDVKEAGANNECGIKLEGYEKFEVGDKIEVIKLEKIVE